MPELPEVETVCRGLSRPSCPAVASRGSIVRTQGSAHSVSARISPPRLTGQRRVEGIRRRAKYVLIDLDDGQVLIVHLGMAGRMQITDPRVPLGAHDHVIFTTDDGRQIRFNDPRRFGLMTLDARRLASPAYKLIPPSRP